MTDRPGRKVRESAEELKPAGNRGKGRVKGVPNKATASLKNVARQHTAEAVEALVRVLKGGKGIPPAAQVAAAKEILDRGYGRASTVLTGDEDGGPMRLVSEIRLIGVRPDAVG